MSWPSVAALLLGVDCLLGVWRLGGGLGVICARLGLRLLRDRLLAGGGLGLLRGLGLRRGRLGGVGLGWLGLGRFGLARLGLGRFGLGRLGGLAFARRRFAVGRAIRLHAGGLVEASRAPLRGEGH